VPFWTDEVVPRMTDKMLGNRDVAEHRKRVIEGLRGEVVEIGFGSGLNVPHYPTDVTTVFAVDPSLVGRKLSAERVAGSSVPIRFVPLGDASVDAALSTFTLCTIPDAARAVREVYRVLRPGGQFHFLEHGLCPEAGVARWQHRLNPIQQRVAGGCTLDRPIEGLIRRAGFDITELHHDQLAGPDFLRPWAYLYEGIATKAA
jgi:SAM-dependent methyltransferase